MSNRIDINDITFFCHINLGRSDGEDEEENEEDPYQRTTTPQQKMVKFPTVLHRLVHLGILPVVLLKM
jgi:hypothetical protein